MSSVLARYEVSGERRKPKPSGSTSSVPSPKIDSPFFAWFLSMAKIRSCLRRRLAFSMPLLVAISTSWETWWLFSSDRCIEWGMGVPGAASGAGAACSADSGRAVDERTASGGTAWGLVILGKCALLNCCGRRATLLENQPRRMLPNRGGAYAQDRLRPSDIAVKEGGELRFGERADAGRLDVAVLEQHQRGDAADAELGRRLLVLVDVDLRDLEAPLVLLRHLVEDRRDRLAGAAPLRPVVDQHRGVGLQDLGLESVVGHALDGVAGHGSSGDVAGRLLLWGRPVTIPSIHPAQC